MDTAGSNDSDRQRRPSLRSASFNRSFNRSFSTGDLVRLGGGLRPDAAAAVAKSHRVAKELDEAEFEALEENFFDACARAIAPIARNYTKAQVAIANAGTPTVAAIPIPDVVLCCWQPMGVDWTAAMRARASVREYVLVGETDDGICGEPWATWGYVAERGRDSCSVSSTSSESDRSDADGQPVPSRWAAWEEVLELCEETSLHEGTTLEWVADGCLNGFDDDEVELMTKMSVTANRPINWNVLTIDSARPEAYRNQLEACEKANEAGAKVVALTMPILVGMNMSLGTFCALFQLPGWMDYFNMGIDARMEKFRDPEVVTWLENQAALPEAGVFSRLTGWDNYMVGDTYSEANEGLKGRTLGDIARERGQRAFHTMVEISLNDDLKTVWWPLPTDDDAESWRLRAQAWEHPNVMIGGSDAGAHLDRMAGAPYTTAWLADCLRGRQLTSMENAVRHLTDVPARLFGFTERGRIAEGWHADIVVFDPETVGATDVELVFDLPGDSKRLWSEATGISRVLVNGVVSVADGTATDAIAGKVMRAGVDTETVSAS